MPVERFALRVCMALCAPAWLTALSPALLAQTAQAGVEGHVVAIENGDIVIDVAGKRGAEGGDVVELWRPLKLKHPVTGKIVTDRFRIGSLELTQVRDALAFAKPKGKLARPPEPGDVVVLQKTSAAGPIEPVTGAPPITAAPPPEQSGAGLDAEARAVTRIFDSLRNAPVATRIARYEDYVRDNPNSRFAVVLYEEARELRRLLALEKKLGARSAAEHELRVESFEQPAPALAGVPLSLGVEIAGPVRGAIVHTRNAGEVAYRSTPMRAAGAGYFLAEIPALRMRAPSLEYFIEATTEAGKAVPIVASADEPNRLAVSRIPRPAPPERHAATVSVLSDYADYNRLKGNDRVWQTEGFVGLRFADEGVRALRTGFGVYRGVGGSLAELDELEKSGRLVGLTYGYLEGEYAFTSFTALVVRGVLGLRDDGVSAGAQTLVRIGNDKKTNLLIGGEVLGGIGLRGITELQLNSFERIPIVLRTEVTNQPAGSSADADDVRPAESGSDPSETSLQQGEVGARAIAQVGYEVFDGFVLALRGSYQGRTINHAGPGAGIAVSYTW